MDTFGTGKALTKGYSLAKDVKAAGVGAYAAGEMGRTAQFASEKAQPVRDAVSAVRGFTPSAVTGEAVEASDSIASTAKWLPGNNFENIASRPFVNNDAGDALKVGGKALGVLGGAVDAVEDIAHGGLYGNNLEKAGNVLTIASTVLDFVPGLEWLGVAGNIAATVLSAAGDAEEDKKQTASDAQQQSADKAPSQAASNITVSQRSAPDASRSQMPASNTF